MSDIQSSRLTREDYTALRLGAYENSLHQIAGHVDSGLGNTLEKSLVSKSKSTHSDSGKCLTCEAFKETVNDVTLALIQNIQTALTKFSEPHTSDPGKMTFPTAQPTKGEYKVDGAVTALVRVRRLAAILLDSYHSGDRIGKTVEFAKTACKCRYASSNCAREGSDPDALLHVSAHLLSSVDSAHGHCTVEEITLALHRFVHELKQDTKSGFKFSEPPKKADASA
ncbi:uncharacterized protein MKK02DRAFT_39294 [Dioszegia hungarica]|uniref:Uncharacterized protein n=1 Tax=Dioszegia hungarica TaxID=4972 RepID=A0AA38LRN1_9TREE|nr:uncharacterized protein MKK02DRAFT_39294 [Dioszegia hungarica]KAI9633315.1 hypothetical protein MKK02DRAFT_39294 [Dioszegia hungarica]